MNTRNQTNRRGFTMIEIMVVILIIGILLAVAVPAFARARANSRAKGCQHNLVQILSAKERWAMDYNRGAGDTPQQSDLTPYYTKNVPLCPESGVYTVNRLDTLPTCSVGGVRGDVNAHVLP